MDGGKVMARGWGGIKQSALYQKPEEGNPLSGFYILGM